MSLKRKSAPPELAIKKIGRRIIMTFEVETHYYPAEICEPTRVALELAGIAVVSCKAEWATGTDAPGEKR